MTNNQGGTLYQKAYHFLATNKGGAKGRKKAMQTLRKTAKPEFVKVCESVLKNNPHFLMDKKDPRYESTRDWVYSKKMKAQSEKSVKQPSRMTVHSDNPQVVKSNKKKILENFDPEDGLTREEVFASEMDNVRSYPKNSTDYKAARFLVESGTIGDIWNVDKVDYLRNQKVRDLPPIEKMSSSQIGQATDLYDHMMARDAVKLYSEIKSKKSQQK